MYLVDSITERAGWLTWGIVFIRRHDFPEERVVHCEHTVASSCLCLVFSLHISFSVVNATYRNHHRCFAQLSATSQESRSVFSTEHQPRAWPASWSRHLNNHTMCVCSTGQHRNLHNPTPTHHGFASPAKRRSAFWCIRHGASGDECAWFVHLISPNRSNHSYH